MKREDFLAAVERLRVGYSQHRDVDYRCGAMNALDDVARLVRVPPAETLQDTEARGQQRLFER